MKRFNQQTWLFWLSLLLLLLLLLLTLFTRFAATVVATTAAVMKPQTENEDEPELGLGLVDGQIKVSSEWRKKSKGFSTFTINIYETLLPVCNASAWKVHKCLELGVERRAT